jgi:hypothetical protein
MKLLGAFLLAALGLACSLALHAADPAKVDYTERNTPYAPAASVSPAKRAPVSNSALQDRRVTPTVLDQPTAVIGSRQAAIDVSETRAKTIVTPDSRRPEARSPELNAFDHRESRFQPDTAHFSPKLAARYQAALTNARAANLSSFSTAGEATTAERVNRFVFHRNPTTPLSTTSVSPAAGASTIVRSTPRVTP